MSYFWMHYSPLCRLETKTDGTKMVVPIRPIACTSGVMDLDQIVVRMI